MSAHTSHMQEGLGPSQGPDGPRPCCLDDVLTTVVGFPGQCNCGRHSGLCYLHGWAPVLQIKRPRPLSYQFLSPTPKLKEKQDRIGPAWRRHLGKGRQGANSTPQIPKQIGHKKKKEMKDNMLTEEIIIFFYNTICPLLAERERERERALKIKVQIYGNPSLNCYLFSVLSFDVLNSIPFCTDKNKSIFYCVIFSDHFENKKA